MKTKTILIAGASGLIGNELLHLCLDDNFFSEVKILVRKPLPIQHKKLLQIPVDFDTLNIDTPNTDADYYCCTLGTTIKKAGSKEAFKKVDYEYPLTLAKIAEKHHAEKFLIVTALGANKHSNVFYSKTKGEIEYQLQKLNLPQLYIFQPSLLVGNRSENRPAEKLAIGAFSLINPLFMGPFKKYRSINVKAVATAMCFAIKHFNNKQRIILSDEIQTIADGKATSHS
jgi:uncharacterized protein YbjT (DUF2867 family)